MSLCFAVSLRFEAVSSVIVAVNLLCNEGKIPKVKQIDINSEKMERCNSKVWFGFSS
jgi:hypothetical protein